MPPKPRFRPRPGVTAQSVAASSSASETTGSQTNAKVDDDDLFIRNKGRSLNKLEKRVAEVVVARASSPASDSDDNTDNEAVITPSAAARGKKNIKHVGQPKWAKKGGIKNVLHDVSDSDGDEDGDDDGSPSKRRRRRGRGSPSDTPRGTQRNRSKSLTPPPELTEMERLRTQMAIEKVLPSVPRRSNVHIDDDKEDGDDEQDQYLDPALQQIVRRVQEQKHYGHIAESSSGPSLVTVQVKWEPHPDDQAASSQSWTFTVNRNDSFKQLALQLSQKALTKLDDLVLMRDGKRIYTAVSAAGLGTWDYLELQACTQATFEALRAMRDFRSPTPVPQSAEGGLQHRMFNQAPRLHGREGSAQPSEASVDHDLEEKFKIILRAPGVQDVALSVRPSTTCAKIVAAYLRLVAAQQGGNGVKLTPRKANKVRLNVDGEKLDPEAPISNCELEDGDQVEVVGL